MNTEETIRRAMQTGDPPLHAVEQHEGVEGVKPIDPAEADGYVQPADLLKRKCPQCGGDLEPVLFTSGPMALNRDQFDAIKAGDFYCTACPNNGRGRSAFCYWWTRELDAMPTNKDPAEESAEPSMKSRLYAHAIMTISELQTKVEALQAIVAKLPKTADGVVIIIGETQVFHCAFVGDEIMHGIVYAATVGLAGGECHVRIRYEDGGRIAGDQLWRASMLYSTREAAEAKGGTS